MALPPELEAQIQQAFPQEETEKEKQQKDKTNLKYYEAKKYLYSQQLKELKAKKKEILEQQKVKQKLIQAKQKSRQKIKSNIAKSFHVSSLPAKKISQIFKAQQRAAASSLASASAAEKKYKRLQALHNKQIIGKNKFAELVARYKQSGDNVQAAREYGSPKINVAREIVKLRELENLRKRQQAQQFNILHASRQLLSPQENNMFSQQRQQANNLFSEQNVRENSIFSPENIAKKKSRINFWSS